jgi:hypothetical protein
MRINRMHKASEFEMKQRSAAARGRRCGAVVLRLTVPSRQFASERMHCLLLTTFICF